jgi:hypothetical protein
MRVVVDNRTGEPGEVLTIRNLPVPRLAPVRMFLSPVHPAA